MESRLTKPQFFYHATYKAWKKTLTLHPKSVEIDGETMRPRICVCPDVPGCISSMEHYHEKNLKVYRTASPVRGYYPYGVCDSFITKERWLLEPTRFIRVMELDSWITFNLFPGSPRGAVEQLEEQAEVMEKIREFFDYFSIPPKPHAFMKLRADVSYGRVTNIMQAA